MQWRLHSGRSVGVPDDLLVTVERLSSEANAVVDSYRDNLLDPSLGTALAEVFVRAASEAAAAVRAAALTAMNVKGSPAWVEPRLKQAVERDARVQSLSELARLCTEAAEHGWPIEVMARG